MSEFDIGDRVKTTTSWNAQYYRKGITGTILRIVPKGANPHHPERNHHVRLDVQVGDWTNLWFDPNHLELEAPA